MIRRLASLLLSVSGVMFARGERPAEIGAILIGSSAATRELREEVELASRLIVRVMIAGEYGIGKKGLAKLLHRHSVRCRAPFVTVRCADFPDAQLEARLFGDWANFTGIGAFERADGGTILLEDVDALSPTLQARLMRVLATGDVQPVGANAVRRRVNVRIICATTIPLLWRLAAGSFRKDLYYLLNTVYLPIAPLRERPEDLDSLLEYFTSYYARRQQVARPQLTLEWRDLCRAYDWPGNVRQLQAVTAMFVASNRPCTNEIFESAARSLRITPSITDVRASSWLRLAHQRCATEQQ